MSDLVGTEIVDFLTHRLFCYLFQATCQTGPSDTLLSSSVFVPGSWERTFLVMQKNRALSPVILDKQFSSFLHRNRDCLDKPWLGI